MGANSTQAAGVLLFLAGFVALAAGLAMRGSVILLLAGVALIGVAALLFRKCKPWEEAEG